MTPRRAKVFAMIFLAATGIASMHWTSFTRADAPATDVRSPELNANLKEQVDTLQAATELAYKQYNQGIGTAEDMDRFNRLLLEARLKMATTPENRVAVLKDALDLAEAEEKSSTDRFKMGLVPEVAVLEAKAYRLTIEEKLLEAGIKL